MASKKDVKELIARAEAVGWEYLGMSPGSKHHRVRWPETGQILTLAGTPGPSSIANAESDLAGISGPLRPRPGPGRSKAQRAADRRRTPPAPRRRPCTALPEPRLPEWKQQLQAWAATHQEGTARMKDEPIHVEITEQAPHPVVPPDDRPKLVPPMTRGRDANWPWMETA